MKRVIRMPSIDQFRNTIYHITRAARFEGIDEDNEPIFNTNSLPVLKAVGTVKLHGTNASVCFNAKNGLGANTSHEIPVPPKPSKPRIIKKG